MSSILPNLYLASQSPRRKQLLENLGLPFQVLLPDGTEIHPTARGISEGVVANARVKAESVASKIDGIAIGADTLVTIDDAVLGKPRDEAEATATLRLLSGREHQVLTGLALVSRHFGARVSCVSTRVTFRPLSDREIAEYVQTREPYDKAGAYGIQGLASLFVTRVDGLYTNVVGLPIETLLSDLAALTGIAPPRWFPK